MKITVVLSLLLAGIGVASASHGSSSGMDVLVDGSPVHIYYHSGITYIEALKGKEYAIRLTNPTGCRVAVALAVDGLNTIDARHTDARSGRKWVLEPYESVVISGWQTNARQARRFFFTTEDRSYGARLGRTDDLGIISAAFFRERFRPLPKPVAEAPAAPAQRADNVSDSTREQAISAGREKSLSSASSEPEYAATGIGERVQHEVQWVHMELEDQPFSVVNLRYEFRPVLVKLGVVPPEVTADPLSRREKARGFRDGLYCPER
jgi:hypothetical protein